MTATRNQILGLRLFGGIALITLLTLAVVTAVKLIASQLVTDSITHWIMILGLLMLAGQIGLIISEKFDEISTDHTQGLKGKRVFLHRNPYLRAKIEVSLLITGILYGTITRLLEALLGQAVIFNIFNYALWFGVMVAGCLLAGHILDVQTLDLKNSKKIENMAN